MHHIDQLFAGMSAVTAVSDNQWRVTHPGLPDDWGQGRTAFGGISAAMVYYALSMIVAPDRVLRTFHTNFVGPVVFDEPFEIVIEQLRSGRNMSQYLVKLNQAGKVSVCVQACYGVELTSKLHINKLPSHQFEPPDKATLMGTDADKLPRFFHHYDLAMLEGQRPFTGSAHCHYLGWMRNHAPVEQFGLTHLIALIDAWPPALVQQLGAPAPMSTVSWDLEFVNPLIPVAGNPWFAYEVNTRFAANGYAHTEAKIWDEQERLVALSRQAVVVFD